MTSGTQAVGSALELQACAKCIGRRDLLQSLRAIGVALISPSPFSSSSARSAIATRPDNPRAVEKAYVISGEFSVQVASALGFIEIVLEHAEIPDGARELLTYSQSALKTMGFELLPQVRRCIRTSIEGSTAWENTVGNRERRYWGL